MDMIDIQNFALLKRDVRALKAYLFTDNDINGWRKLIIIYNMYLLISHMYVLYKFAEYFSYSDKSFSEDFKKVFMLFFVICNLQNTYRYGILNVSKIDPFLANDMYKHSKEYFV